jgi:hypothetical protein
MMSVVPASPSIARDALKQDDSHSILIGVGATLLFHVALFLLAPLFPVESIGGGSGSFFGLTGAQLAKGKEFNIELAPDEIKPPEAQKAPFQFVETNPEAPDNAPDKTENFSNRNQQLAQKEPDLDSKATAPRTEGREDIKNDTAIVSGSLAQPQPGAPPVEITPETVERAAQQARAEQVPLSGTEKIEGKAEDGIGATVSDVKTPSNNAKEHLEGAKDGRDATGGLVVVNAQQKQTPRERPRVSQATTARPNPLQKRQFGTNRIGPLGFDARWSDFGEYLQQYIETVQIRWEGILSERQTFPPSPSYVIITFTLSAEGLVTTTKVEASTTDRPGELAALAAITGKVEAFRPWSEAMIAVMGREQTLTFQFHY